MDISPVSSKRHPDKLQQIRFYLHVCDSRHFRSIRHFIFIFIFSQNGLRRPSWMTENYFRSHFSPFQINTSLYLYFFSQNGLRRPSWMTENHFRSHFSPFQINTQLLFFWKLYHKMTACSYFR